MKVKAKVVETITVERDIEVEVPEGSVTRQGVDGVVWDALTEALYQPPIVDPKGPWSVSHYGGPNFNILHEKCIQVEYDENHWGGDYNGVGKLAYVPLSVIDTQTPNIDLEDPKVRKALDLLLPPGAPARHDLQIRMAFQQVTNVHPIHIVHYCPDETYDQYGNEWNEEWEKGHQL